MTAGAAALALGYLGCTGPLPDLPATAADANATEKAATDMAATDKPATAAAAAAAANGNGSKAASSEKADDDKSSDAAAAPSNAVLVRIAKLLPTTSSISQRDGGQAAVVALSRAATALGLGCLGEQRQDVLRVAVKGACLVVAVGWVDSRLVNRLRCAAPALQTPLRALLLLKQPHHPTTHNTHTHTRAALTGLSQATKSEELLLVAGESLALAFGGVPLTAAQLLRSPGGWRCHPPGRWAVAAAHSQGARTSKLRSFTFTKRTP